MAVWTTCAPALVLFAAIVNPAVAGDGVVLREAPKVGEATNVLIEMKAEGKFVHESLDGDAKAKANPKPSPMKVESRLEFFDRVMQVGDEGRVKRSARRVVEGMTAIAGQPDLLKIRPEMALLTADRRDSGVVVISPSGPLMRSELDLVQAPGDPLSLDGLLPKNAVREGDKWPVAIETAKALCDYDSVSSNGLEAKLETVDETSARVRVGGQVKGLAQGAEGTIVFSGWFTFDRKAGRIDRVEISRSEVRKPGPVELGLDVKSTLSVERTSIASAPGLGDDVLAALPRDAEPRREWLVLSPPGAKYSVEHDRDWHLTYEDPKQVVLKRMQDGAMVAHCRLSVGPNAGKGRHQDPDGFREDVRRALGGRFQQVLEASASDGGPGENYQYKVSVAGRERDVAILWYYYLVAGPGGDQLLATFTLEQAAEKRFGDGDQRLIETLSWKPAATPIRPK